MFGIHAVRRIVFSAGLLAQIVISGNICGQASPAKDPAGVLGDALSAACGQKTGEFSQYLTQRNASSYKELTPPAQLMFLKRFVLLDNAGVPQVSQSANGIVTLRCKTPEVETETTIGHANLHDNLAYLPVSIREAAQDHASEDHSIQFGLVREDGQWKLLSLGLILLDLPTLGEEWDRAEIKSNESAALASLKKLGEAIEIYRKTYTRLPDSIAVLGAAKNGKPGPEGADYISESLASGRKDGYLFRYVIVGASTSGAPAKYEIAASPAEYNRTGKRSFFRDQDGTLHVGDHHGGVGSTTDPKVTEND